MSTYLSVSNLSKTYGSQPVLHQVSLTLSAGQRVGLVGANGVGKSTLLKIITGELEADSGTVALLPGAAIGYLAQTVPDSGDKTLDDLIADSMRHLHELEARMRDLEKQMALGAGGLLDTVLVEYGEVTGQFERYGGYELEYRVDAVLNGLGVGHISRERRFATLSGGEKTRVNLAMLLLKAPDVLLLDEPTNHLDYASLNWLEEYLRSYRGAILTVSHDRQFLNRTVNVIVEIDEHTHSTRRYTGDYDAYHQAKLIERRRWEAGYAAQQEEIKALRIEIKDTAHRNSNYRAHRDGDKFVYNFKRATHDRTVSKRIQAAQEKLRRIEENPIPKPPEPLHFEADFDPTQLHGRVPLRVDGLTKTFGARRVLDGISFALGVDSRVTLVGPNGAGKSTLLKILAGVETPDSGELYVHSAVKIGYLDQEQRTLDPAKTVFEAYQDGLPGHEQQLKAMLLSSGLFRYEELDRHVGQLSSGQQRKLQIARLMVGQANLLVLDEPTNYISFDVLEELEAALRDFPGPVIAASHDRRFMQQFGGEMWELRDGTIIRHPTLEDYLTVQMLQPALPVPS